MTLIVMKTLERVYKNYYFIIRGDFVKITTDSNGTAVQISLADMPGGPDGPQGGPGNGAPGAGGPGGGA